jgi:hypothetical protein
VWNATPGPRPALSFLLRHYPLVSRQMERNGGEKETSRRSKKNSHRRWNSLLFREIASGFFEYAQLLLCERLLRIVDPGEDNARITAID